jgi:uncharacterized membrane protein
VVRSDGAGAIQAVNVDGLARWARRHDCLIVLPHPVGDFVTEGESLVEVHGSNGSTLLVERELRGFVALGLERTIEQDPAFAIRIMVDIATMALSPAVNAPTTAVQVLDYLEDVLRLIGTQELTGWMARRDGDGRLLVVGPVPSWEQFLALGTTEIRLYGGGAIQVVKRLHAMLQALREVVRPEFRAAVDEELAKLEATVAERFGNSADLPWAVLADRQGLGGAGLTQRSKAS